MAISVLRRVVDNTILSRVSSTAMKPSTSMDSAEHKKTRHKLKKLLTGRPTLQTVKDKGYIKGAKETTATLEMFSVSFLLWKVEKMLQAAKVWKCDDSSKEAHISAFFLTTACRLRLELYIWMHHVSFGVFLVIYFTFKTFGLRHQSPVFTHKSGIYDSFSPSVP